MALHRVKGTEIIELSTEKLEWVGIIEKLKNMKEIFYFPTYSTDFIYARTIMFYVNDVLNTFYLRKEDNVLC